MGLFSRTLSRLDELKKALTRDPASRQFLALADEYRRQGQREEAIDVLERGLEQSPTSVAGHVALGRLLQQNGRLDEALASFQAALRLDPQNLVALRQTADLHLSRGDKVEAIKKLKLFRGLNPGDREVNELIRQLDDELAAAASPKPPVLPPPEAPPPPAPEFRTGPIPAASIRPAVPPVPTVGSPSPDVAAVSDVPEELPAGGPSIEAPGFDAGTLPPETESPTAREEDLPLGGSPPAVPEVTETLAELLRKQGHLGEAQDAYGKLAGSESDADRALRFLGIAQEISAARAGTLRGRLETWVRPFTRNRGLREADLVAAVEEAVERLGPASAVVTDFEGVPVVSAGPRSEAEAMENLAAELTAFWKNARRSRAEIGEGALTSLVLSGSTATAAVMLITPAYALLLKTGPGIPTGRIRFEAARAAEQLRPALL